MLVCPFCSDVLQQVGDTVIACACEGSRQSEIEDRHKKKAWLTEYTQAMDKQRIEKQKNRKR